VTASSRAEALSSARTAPSGLWYKAAMRQSLTYFVVAGFCAASAVTSTLTGHVSVVTVLGPHRDRARPRAAKPQPRQLTPPGPLPHSSG
jgi:hypothetical protein